MSIDILMITHDRPEYTSLSLARLLLTCDSNTRVWIWQNGCHQETLGVVGEFLDHPRVFRYHHSEENRKLRDPTNWILRECQGDLVGKVDDDCLVPPDWIHVLRSAHAEVPELGSLGCWHFHPDDYRPELAERKVRTFTPGHRVLCHPWIGGSGFLVKRACVERVGLIRESDRGITAFHLRVAQAGWTNGWYFPLLYQDHMDDPRSPFTMFKTQEDYEHHAPLSAWRTNATTIKAWEQQLRESALYLQTSPAKVEYYTGWRPKYRRLRDAMLRPFVVRRKEA